MIDRILYWFITLPVLGKTGCLGLIVLLLACTGGTLATIPATRARVAAEATQTAVAQQAQAAQVVIAQQAEATQVALNTIATSRTAAAATEQAQSDATATGVAAVQQATEAAVADQTASAVAVSLAASSTSRAIQSATDTAVAMVQMTQAVVAQAETAAAIPTPTPIPQVAYTELGRWEKDGRLWVAVRIPPGVASADLRRLALTLRTSDPAARYYVFDDDAQFPEFKSYQVQGTAYPEAWIAAHNVAMINQMGTSSGLEWQLMLQITGETYPVELATSLWGGKRDDGSITSEEAAGWASLFMTQTENYACCVTRVQVTAGSRPIITITLDGELATRTEQSRQQIATAALFRFQGELGECPDSVLFVDTDGSPIGDGYTPTRCS